MRFLYDTTVFVYAVGRDHPYREPCREIVERATRGEISGEASVELVQELIHVRSRGHGDRAEALQLGGNVAQLCRLHAFEPTDLPLMFALLDRHDRLDTRDALYAATALNRNISAILSPDRAFDGIHGLQRIDPLDEQAVAEL